MARHSYLAQIRNQRISLLQRVESGSMDGGNYADIVFIPYLVGVLVFGIFIALIGFWRVGASFATQASVQVGSVAPSDGNATLSGAWAIWTNSNSPSSGFVLNSAERSVSSGINTGQGLEYFLFGPMPMTINGQSHSRSERFYPGGPVCSGGECDE
jgi:hypothetical protein